MKEKLKFEMTVDEGQVRLIRKFAHRGATRNEYLAASGLLSQEELEVLREQSPTDFNIDVIGVLQHVYPDEEKAELKTTKVSAKAEPNHPGLCLAWSAYSGLCGAQGLVYWASGNAGGAVESFAIATAFGIGAKVLNDKSGGANAVEVKDFVVDHCPPKYSERYVDGLVGEAFRHGVEAGIGITQRLGSARMTEKSYDTGPIYRSADGKVVIDSLSELAFSLGKSSEVAAKKIARIVLIKRAGEQLSEEQIETLRRAKSLMDVTGLPPEVFCEKGQEIVAEMNSIISDFEKTRGI